MNNTEGHLARISKINILEIISSLFFQFLYIATVNAVTIQQYRLLIYCNNISIGLMMRLFMAEH